MLIAVHDTETTGLPRHKRAKLDGQPRIIEFAGIITDGKSVISQLEFICNPQVKELDPIITKITGLTLEDLIDKPTLKEFLPQLTDYFGAADAVISHNLSFDKGMMEFDLQRLGLSLSDVRWPRLEVCTVEQTMHQFGRRMKLQELYERECGPYVQKHRAMDDLLLLHEVCQRYGVYAAMGAC
ncbi:three-prime repair exonuclease I [Luteibacter phage vB_LflM-Pluto]|uniref:Three-prime repair exonuclease I n=1 Tax=Luteibacter phage vB_LflM-Pluto TaxID=2948611 RepID=A0A9E7MUN1_9CAUD|nr:three-prime repair exonuclease I [Luteibacter phage vB_LflM-Pluto]